MKGYIEKQQPEALSNSKRLVRLLPKQPQFSLLVTFINHPGNI